MRFLSFPGIAIIFLLLILIKPDAVGQPSTGNLDSHSLFHYYDRMFRADSRLISGNFYQDLSPKSTEGHPYNGDGEWAGGSVVIRGVEFDSLQLRYDIYTNELVINTLNFNNTPLQVALNKLHITSFTLGNRKFIHFPSDDPRKSDRFCEVLSEGPATLVLMQTKSLIIPANGNSVFSYDTYSRMYLFLKGKLNVYNGKRTLVSAFPEYKVLLQNYIRTEKLKFRSGKFDSHARLVNYCNTLLSVKK